MKKLITLSYLLLLFGFASTAQEWVQTGGTPEGGGVTEIIVLPNSDIFVTTGSFNWPTINGGVRRSTDDGETWENVFDAFNGRTITAGADGNLYASVWPFPADEGLYRSSDNGDTWDLLVTVPTGNNIFSITVNTSTSPVTILAGTRNGVLRSTDNGATWAFSSAGIPEESWVRDIEVDLISGKVAAGTTNGLFISADNGSLWEEATGDGIENETVTKIVFEYPTDNFLGDASLLAGTATGRFYRTIVSSLLILTLVAILSQDEISGLLIIPFVSILQSMIMIAQYSTSSQPDGVSRSIDNGVSWSPFNFGLPIAPLLSALAGIFIVNDFILRLGMYENTANGAKVYKSSVSESDFPTAIREYGSNALEGILLYQNYPNPFENSTLIMYTLKNTGPVNLSVYAADGKLVRSLVNSLQLKGEHTINFNAENLTEGVYYYKLESEGISEIKRMVVLR